MFFLLFFSKLSFQVDRSKDSKSLKDSKDSKSLKDSKRLKMPPMKRQRQAAQKALLGIKACQEYDTDPFINAFVRPEDEAYMAARAAHLATIVHTVSKHGKRCGHLGKGTGAAFDQDFNGKTQQAQYVAVTETDVALLDDADEEVEVPRKWRRLRPKYALK